MAAAAAAGTTAAAAAAASRAAGAAASARLNFYGGGGGGGGSYLAPLAFTDPVLLSGVNHGNGFVTIDPVVPEPSTWAMTLAGFAGLGWLARLRARKSKPA